MSIEVGKRLAATTLETPVTQARQGRYWRVLERAFGAAGAADAAPALTVRIVSAIVALLVVWRIGILALSTIWARVGIANPWDDPIIGGMWLWRYSVRWDAGWYLGIVRYGYEYIPGQASSVAFFPLLPLLTSLLHQLVPGSPVLAALVVVHAALAAALVYVFQLVRMDFDERTAWRTIAFVLLFPTAFFFSAVYAESLLLLGIAGALYHARRGQWWRAALFGIVASASKIVGILIVLPLALEIWRQRGTVSIRNPWPAIAVASSTFGTLGYFAWLQFRFGDFRVFFEVESAWHRDSFDPVFLMGIRYLLGDDSPLVHYPANPAGIRGPFLLIDTVLLYVFIVAGIVLWRRVRPSYAALVASMPLLPALSGSPQSINRYVAVLFPAFMMLARIEREEIRQAITLVFGLSLVMTTFLFVNGYWAG